jgi:glycosyltransferase involved in cell wall biosynthesis
VDDLVMRILMVISQFHPIIGGAEKQAMLLAQALVRRSIKVDVITGWWKFGTPHKETIEGIKIVRNFSCWGMFRIKGIRTIGALIYMFTLGFYLFTHRRDYDIIHVHQVLYPAFVSVFIGKQILRKPVLVKTASSGKTSDLKLLVEFPLGGFQSRYLLRKMDYLVAVSKMSGKDFIECGYPESRIVFIPNGVEIASKEASQTNAVADVVTTTRFSKEKGVDILLKACKIILQKEKNIKLTIIGDGPLKSEVRKMAQSLEISESVKFTGLSNNVATYLRHADLFVLPSRTEGMPNALLEAMSYGIASIATKVGGNSELLGGEDKEIRIGEYVIARNGLLVNPDDVVGLSEGILYLVRHKEEREELGRRGRMFIKENYSIDSIADRYISLYQSILNKGS